MLDEPVKHSDWPQVAEGLGIPRTTFLAWTKRARQLAQGHPLNEKEIRYALNDLQSFGFVHFSHMNHAMQIVTEVEDYLHVHAEAAHPDFWRVQIVSRVVGGGEK